MKPRIVEFTNGKFGIQVHWYPWKEFTDLTGVNSFWSYRMKTPYFKDCQGTLKQCEKQLQLKFPTIKRIVK